MEETSTANNRDPHHDAYLNELSLLVDPLRGFQRKVSEHLVQWPDNAILQRLMELTDKLERLPMSAPLMRWLVGLEALLGKADEWEMVASKEVSLKDEIHNLARFVIRWRKLELESWSMVLERRHRDARKKTMQWWFNLHELVESAGKDPFWAQPATSWAAGRALTVKDAEPSKESVQVFAVLDQFARTATLGDFSLRCELLEAFAGYVHTNFPSATALALTLRNLARYYRQFQAKVQDHLVKSREPIQQKLTDHVKIATWDDRNYFALRESAEKSHRVVHKLARAFDEVLESAAHPAMEQFAEESAIFETPESLAASPPFDVAQAQQNAAKRKKRTKKKQKKSKKGKETPEEEGEDHDDVDRIGSDEPFPLVWIAPFKTGIPIDSETTAILPSTLASLDRDIVSVTRRASKLIHNRAIRILEARDDTTGRAALDLDEDARSRLRSLTKDSPMQVKKRALIDFFSELKRNGVLDGIVPNQLRDSRAVLSTDLVFSGADTLSGLKSVARWGETVDSLFRCVTQLTRLRQAILSPERSRDLSQDECTRGLKACERMTWMALAQREWICSTLCSTRNEFLQEVARWSDFVRSDEEAVDEMVHLLPIENGDDIQSTMDSVLVGTKDLNFLMRRLAPSQPQIATEGLTALQVRYANLRRNGMVRRTEFDAFRSSLREEMESILGRVKRSGVPSCEALIDRINSFVQEIDAVFERATRQSIEHVEESEVAKVLNEFVETCMLAVQGLVKQSGTSGEEGSDEINEELWQNEQGIAHHHDFLVGALQSLQLPRLVQAMKFVSSTYSSFTANHRGALFSQLIQLVMPLVSYVEQFVNSFLSFHRSLCRFLQFGLSVFRTLCAKGFCRPPEEDEEQGGSGGAEENLREGTGMGEGEGQKNVSEEMEDEEQLLGLKGDQEQQPEKDDKKDKQEEDEEGVEMQNDFEGGDMHDVEQDDEEQEDEEDDENKKEEEEELDREMGDLGDESNVVDEKLWDSDEDSDDDEGKGDDEKEEKFEKNAPMQGKDDDDELRAKDKDEADAKQPESRKDEDKKKKKKDDLDDKKDDGAQDREEDDEEQQKGFEKEQIEENHDVDMKKEFTEDEEEAEGEGEDQPEEHPGDLQDEQDVEDLELPPPDTKDDQGGEDQEEGDDQDEDAEDDNADNEDDLDEDDNKEVQGPDNDEADQEEDHDDEAGKLSLPAPAAQPQQDEDQHDQDDDMEGNNNAQGDKAAKASSSKDQQQEQEDEQQREAEPNDRDEKPGDLRGTAGGAGGNKYRRGASSEPQDEEDESRQKPQEKEGDDAKEPNPWRDPGNAAKEWTRRLKMVETGENGAQDVGEDEDNNEEQQDRAGQDADLYEFNRKKEDGDAEDEDLKQTLGARDEEQEMKPESQVRMEEEDEEDHDNMKDRKRKEKAPEPDGAEDKSKDETREANKKPKEKKKKRKGFFDDLGDEKQQEEEEAKGKVDEQETTAAKPMQAASESHRLVSTKLPSSLKHEIEEEDEVKMDIVALEEEPLTGEQLEQGRQSWAAATSATHEMAQRLCEQLRLVLEPTTATKLKGDYRTGKRINMRRVIPFIASQFKKDKIWLRRTKPSRRKYHVALAIDDSRSMRPAKNLALAALALISRALTQLEVGEVGVWSFGSQVRKLHDLSQPFGDTAGARVAAHFGFDQDSTCIEEGLGAVVEALMTAAQASDGKSLSDQPRQLAFIVSDGRFDTGLRPRMAKWLRIARERRQLVALIVVEPPGGESILDLKQVSFGTGATMGMKVNRYLEDYPFPYYIVLRDMAVLPEVLADGLRQWFELIVGEEKQ